MKIYPFYILVILILSCHSATDHTKRISKIPPFKMLSIDSNTCVNMQDIPAGHPIIFMYFSPDCEHCQWETQNIVKHLDELGNTHIYLITNDTSEDLKKFYLYYHLDTVKNIFVGSDYEYTFYKYYLPPATPFFAIYNGKKDLVKIYQGETDINSIINTVSE